MVNQVESKALAEEFVSLVKKATPEFLLEVAPTEDGGTAVKVVAKGIPLELQFKVTAERALTREERLMLILKIIQDIQKDRRALQEACEAELKRRGEIVVEDN